MSKCLPARTQRILLSVACMILLLLFSSSSQAQSTINVPAKYFDEKFVQQHAKNYLDAVQTKRDSHELEVKAKIGAFSGRRLEA